MKNLRSFILMGQLILFSIIILNGCCSKKHCVKIEDPGIKSQIVTKAKIRDITGGITTKSGGGPDNIYVQVIPSEEYIGIKSKLNTSEVLEKRPDGWPRNLDYSPLKSTGPFNYRQFEEIQVLLKPSVSYHSIADIFFNSYFDEISSYPLKHELDIYKIYLANSQFNTTPEFPLGSDVNGKNVINVFNRFRPSALGILLQLQNISYSNKYGGSVCLEFNMIEDHFYEFWFPFKIHEEETQPEQGYLYDLKKLNMLFYVKPDNFRPSNLPNYRGPIGSPMYIEFVPTIDKIFYSDDFRNNNSYIFSNMQKIETKNWGIPIDSLTTFLKEQYIPIVKGQLSLLSSFLLGLLHNEHRTQLVDDFVIDNVQVSDGEFALYTHIAKYFLNIRYRLKSITGIDTEIGAEEFIVKTKGYHDMYGEYTKTPLKTIHGTESSYFTIASIPIEEFYNIDEEGVIKITEDEQGNPQNHKNGSPCLSLWNRGGFEFHTAFHLTEDDPFVDEIFYDYEAYRAAIPWGIPARPENYQWIERRHPLLIRPIGDYKDDSGESKDYQDHYGCGTEGGIEWLVRQGGGVYRNIEISVPVGQVNGSEWGSLHYDVSVSVIRR